jgi:hypothetical protein
VKKNKPKVSSPSLFGEEVNTSFEPIKSLELKKVKVEQKVVEQTLFDIPALPVQTKRVKVKEVVKVVPVQDTNTPCYKLLFPFPHHEHGLLKTYNMDNPQTKSYYEKLKLELCQNK